MAAYDKLKDVIGRTSPDVITRANIGKTDIHPKIKGYFYVVIDLPDEIFDDTEREYAKRWLAATATSFTPHGKSLNLVDLNAMGGIQHSYVSGATYTRDITIGYYDYADAPVFKIHEKWVNMISDPYTGLSALDEYSPSSYKGNIIVIKTKPVGAQKRLDTGLTQFKPEHIEHVWVYPGVIPQDDQSSALDDDIAGQSEVMLSYTYRFDGYPLTEDYKPDLKQLAASYLNTFASDNNSGVLEDFVSNIFESTDSYETIT